MQTMPIRIFLIMFLLVLVYPSASLAVTERRIALVIGNSAYTSALLKYLQAPGLTISDVFINVRAKVMKETGQVPWELSSLGGQFYFLPGSAKMATDKSETKEALENKTQKEKTERQSVQIQTSEPSSFADLKKKIEERREKESQWVKDFEDAKKIEEESSNMPEKIQVWQQFLATLTDEHTTKSERFGNMRIIG